MSLRVFNIPGWPLSLETWNLIFLGKNLEYPGIPTTFLKDLRIFDFYKNMNCLLHFRQFYLGFLLIVVYEIENLLTIN